VDEAAGVVLLVDGEVTAVASEDAVAEVFAAVAGAEAVDTRVEVEVDTTPTTRKQ
jgi:hypothetical protein